MSSRPSLPALDRRLVGFRIRSKILQDRIVPETVHNNETFLETNANQAGPEAFDDDIVLDDFIDASVFGDENNAPLPQSSEKILPEAVTDEALAGPVKRGMVTDSFAGPLPLGTLMSSPTLEASFMKATDVLKDCDMTQFPRLEKLTQTPAMISCGVNYNLCPLRWASLPCIIQNGQSAPITQDSQPFLLGEDDVPILLQADQISVTCFDNVPSPLSIIQTLQKSRALEKFTIGQPGKLYMVTGVMTGKNLRRKVDQSILTVSMSDLEHSHTLGYETYRPGQYDMGAAAISEDTGDVVVAYKVLELTLDGWKLSATQTGGDKWSIGI